MTGYAAVFAFDGEHWRSIKIPNTSFLYGLALMDDDRIAVCGVGQVGFLEKDDLGRRSFRSLLPEIPEAYRDMLGEMWDIFFTDEGLFFFTRDLMLRWRDGEIKVWPFETERMIYGFNSGSSIYVQNLGHGLYRLNGDEIIEVSKEPLFTNPGPRMLVDRVEGGLLVVTQKEGLWKFDGEELSQLETEANDVLIEGIMNRGKVLPDGNLALGTFNNGLIVVSPEGEFLQHLSEGNGLPNNSVVHVSMDREQGLWCSLGTGIARVDMAGALSYYDLANGLPSVSVREILRFQEQVYLASAQGLFRLRPVELPERARWERVAGVQGEMFDLIEHDGSLFAAAQGRVMQVDGDKPSPVWDGDNLIRAVVPSTRDPNLIYIGTRQGLGVSAKVDGVWQPGGRVTDSRVYVQSIVEMPNGDVWAGTQRSGVWRFRSDLSGMEWGDGAVGTAFGEEDGLPIQAPLFVSMSGDKLRVTAVGASFLWNEESEAFEPELQAEDQPPLEGWAWDVFVRDKDKKNAWGSVYPLAGASDDFNLYYGRETIDDEGRRSFKWLPSEIFQPIGGVSYQYIEYEDSVLWAGGATGLLRWEMEAAPEGVIEFPLQPLLRKATVGGTDVSDLLGEEDVSNFDYDRSAMRFTFAAPVMGGGIEPE